MSANSVMFLMLSIGQFVSIAFIIFDLGLSS